MAPNTQSNPDDPQNRRSMAPTFLGVLSKAPAHTQADSEAQTEVPHPFSQNVPALKKAPKVGPRPQINTQPGGQVFSTTPKGQQMTLSPAPPGRADHQKLRNSFQEIRDSAI